MVWYSTVEPRNFPLTGQRADRTEIFLKASLDGGRTWGERRTVNDDAGKGANHSLPGVSIAPNGRVDIAWSDSRNSPRPQASPGREQDARAGANEGESEDVYFATLRRDRSAPVSHQGESVPAWAELAAGVALGRGRNGSECGPSPGDRPPRGGKDKHVLTQPGAADRCWQVTSPALRGWSGTSGR